MRVLPTGLQDHLNSGTTSLCLCWQLTLRSGEVIGFTDHDVTLNLGVLILKRRPDLLAAKFKPPSVWRLIILKPRAR